MGEVALLLLLRGWRNIAQHSVAGLAALRRELHILWTGLDRQWSMVCLCLEI